VRYDRFVLMFQKEVAQRLAAQPGSKTYGRLSVMVQWRCTVSALFDLPPRAFTPPPKVTSTVVELLPRAEPLAPAPAALLSRIVAAAFGQRRKMLRSSLKQLTPVPETWLDAAGVPATARAEDLSIADFCRLASAAERAGH
jgi:16S rRNA (adenine1518-N6/adenine1519-N6)-dimethyltransferase